jgi:mRNA interferase MazF
MTMKKDFKDWNTLKTELNDDAQRPYFHEGEVWWCSLGANIGFEIDGKNSNYERPVFILRKFNKETCWAIPTTSKEKIGRFYYSYLYKGKKFALNLSQVRLLDVKRLSRRAHVLSAKEHEEVKAEFVSLLT